MGCVVDERMCLEDNDTVVVRLDNMKGRGDGMLEALDYLIAITSTSSW